MKESRSTDCELDWKKLLLRLIS